MFQQFGATADSLSKASTIMFRIGTDAHLYDDPDDVSIPPLLDSKFDTEKCEALKRLLALIAQGFDVSNYFPQVYFYNIFGIGEFYSFIEFKNTEKVVICLSNIHFIDTLSLLWRSVRTHAYLPAIVDQL